MYKKMHNGEYQLIRMCLLNGLKFRKVLHQYEEQIPELCKFKLWKDCIKAIGSLDGANPIQEKGTSHQTHGRNI